MSQPVDAGGPPTITELQRTSRDPEQLRQHLEAWLAQRVTGAATVTDLEATSANGMSSETVLFRAGWTEHGQSHAEQLVARVAPAVTDVPVFPSYEMDRQFRIIRLVGELTSVPVPRALWSEPDPTPIGAPF